MTAKAVPSQQLRAAMARGEIASVSPQKRTRSTTPPSAQNPPVTPSAKRTHSSTNGGTDSRRNTPRTPSSALSPEQRKKRFENIRAGVNSRQDSTGSVGNRSELVSNGGQAARLQAIAVGLSSRKFNQTDNVFSPAPSQQTRLPGIDQALQNARFEPGSQPVAPLLSPINLDRRTDADVSMHEADAEENDFWTSPPSAMRNSAEANTRRRGDAQSAAAGPSNSARPAPSSQDEEDTPRTPRASENAARMRGMPTPPVSGSTGRGWSPGSATQVSEYLQTEEADEDDLPAPSSGASKGKAREVPTSSRRTFSRVESDPVRTYSPQVSCGILN